MLFPVLRIAIGVYLLLLLLAYLFQSRLVFMPNRQMAGTPADAGMAYEDLTLTAADGVKLGAWFVPAPGEARGAALFCHGNAGNISHRTETISIACSALRLDTLIFDYRGYGRSQGKPSEAGTYLDARAAWDWLTKEKKVPPGKIIVWGRSLGSAVASHLAAEVRPPALILESVLSSVPDVGADMYPFLPVRWLARIHYDNVEHVGRIQCPLLLVHSPRDEMLDIKYGRRVFAAAREPKEFLEITGDHNSGFLASGRLYIDGVDRFVTKHLGK